MAEDLVLWHSQEWSFASCGDAYTTGSSIMPQKRNPDMAELIRGKTGRVYGALLSLLVVMKGLPLAYNRDMQEDKEPLFDAALTLSGCLTIMASMYRTLTFDTHRFEEERGADFILATELADYLARKGMPFREAHGVVGALVKRSVSEGKQLRDLSQAQYREHSRLFGRDVHRLLQSRHSVSLKRSAGSTSPAEVEKSLRKWERELGATPTRRPRRTPR
jgi:argininosuccinate lyase